MARLEVLYDLVALVVELCDPVARLEVLYDLAARLEVLYDLAVPAVLVEDEGSQKKRQRRERLVK
jgi:hypothetical protein